MSFLDDMELSTRATRVLADYSIDTVEKFMSLEPGFMATWKGAGSKTITEIMHMQIALNSPNKLALIERASTELWDKFSEMLDTINDIMTSFPELRVCQENNGFLVAARTSMSSARRRVTTIRAE